MKKIIRICVFSAFALFLTSYWNKGFILSNSVVFFFGAVVLLSFVVLVINPLSKVVLLPFNLLSFGLFSFLLYSFIIHLGFRVFHFYTIRQWSFPGLSTVFFSIPSVTLTYILNLILCSVSLSCIINVLDQLT